MQPIIKNEMAQKNARQEAFTLVELITSCAILAILFVSLFYGIAQGYNIIQSERENLRATQIMLGRMEGLHLEAWGTNQLFNLTYVPNTFTDYFYPVGLGGFNSNAVVYTGTMTITTNPASISGTSSGYAPNMALVTVTVSWNDNNFGLTNTHTKSMSTYVAQYGIQNYTFNN